PPDRCARFLEVRPHHDHEAILERSCDAAEPPGVVERRIRLVDRARTHDHGDAFAVAPAEDLAKSVARAADSLERAAFERMGLLDHPRRTQRRYPGYVDVFDVTGFHVASLTDCSRFRQSRRCAGAPARATRKAKKKPRELLPGASFRIARQFCSARYAHVVGPGSCGIK